MDLEQFFAALVTLRGRGWHFPAESRCLRDRHGQCPVTAVGHAIKGIRYGSALAAGDALGMRPDDTSGIIVAADGWRLWYEYDGSLRQRLLKALGMETPAHE